MIAETLYNRLISENELPYTPLRKILLVSLLSTTYKLRISYLCLPEGRQYEQSNNLVGGSIYAIFMDSVCKKPSGLLAQYNKHLFVHRLE